jgi:DNA-binding winged helix-turn-helix (wHTH) protein/tetratricopeptide (TPR) repeat protein
MPGADAQTGKELYEFGPFRIDPERQLLLRDGELIALAPKAFQLLLVLVRRGNQIVSKDELMKAVWPETFVEETNLTRNIFILRKALGETELDPFIVTVPGQGYRFATAVRPVAKAEMCIAEVEHAKVRVQVEETHHWRWITAIAVLLAAAAGAWSIFRSRPVVLGEKDTVVLADFVNSTGDPVFDDTLRQGMAVQLEQSPFLSLVSEERIRHTLSLMGVPEDAHFTPKLARQVCERLGSAAVIDGSIARMGTRYVLGLHAANCTLGETLDDEQVQVAREEDVLDAVTRIAGKFRSRAGESFATLQQHATPLAEATTPSLEALKAYSSAWKVAFSNPQQAIFLLQRAIQIDPNFAMAYSFQGRLYADVWEPVLSQQSQRKAYELRQHTNDRERLFIELNYEDGVTGDLEKNQEICGLWTQTYPRDGLPHNELAWTDQELGKYEDSVHEAQTAIGFDPDFTPGYTNLAWAYVLSDRPDEAQKTLQRASERKLQMPEMLVMRYYIAFLKADKAGMEGAAKQALGQSEAEDWVTYEQGTVLALSGHLKQARMMESRAVQLARQANQPERAAMYEAGMAVREAFYGEALEARRDALAALALSDGRDVEWGAALAHALSGDFPESQKLTADLEKRFPNDTFVRMVYLPELRALAALHGSDPARSLDLLQAATPFELGVPGSWSGFFGNLYPAYLRGEAYLEGHRTSESLTEFQKVLAHPGIVFTDPVAALAHLQLGRAYSRTGDKTRARSSYEEFLTLWKDADPEIPILRQAKAEYAKLQ